MSGNRAWYGLLALSFSFGLWVTCYPPAAYSAGNIFFGEVPTLYNLTLARFFFTRAVSSPILATPMFAHHQLSRTYFVEGKLDLALKEAHAELVLYPNNTRTYYILGLTYGFMGRELEAISIFSRYIDEYPESWPARNDLAWLQFRIGDIDSALSTIEPVTRYVKTPWVQNTYCALLINKGRYDEAQTACAYALAAVMRMNEADWGHSYPGNDPRIYKNGLEGTRRSIERNLEIIREHEGTSTHS